MNQVVKEKWINALTSGKYKQGKGCLRDNQDSFCCLGVLTDLAAKEGIVEWTKNPNVSNGLFSVKEAAKNIYGNDVDVYEKDALPEEVMKWAGLDDSNPMIEEIEKDGFDEEESNYTIASLASANDGGMTFKEIAEIIKEQL